MPIKVLPPKNIKVGPFNYEVVTDTAKYNAFKLKQENGDDCIGHTATETQTIYLQHDLPYEVMAETLHHEIMHAVYYNSALDHIERPSEEAVVSLLSIGMLTVLKDNPKLIDFLFKKGQSSTTQK